MSSIQTLHEVLWNLSEVIWKNIQECGLIKLRETIPDRLKNNWWWIRYYITSSKIQIDEVKAAIQGDSIYNQALRKIAEKYNLSKEEAESRLLEFCIGMLIRLVANNESKFISQQIVIFMNELDENPIKYTVGLLLDGIRSKSEEMRFDLRENLALVAEKEEYLDIIEIGIDGIIEAKKIDDVKRTLENIMDTLRLYGLAGVEIVDGNISPDCFLQERLDMNAILSNSPFVLEIEKKHVKVLQKFFREFYPLITDVRTDLSSSYIDIALQRFRDALMRRGPYEQTVTYAITSLEAMLLKPKEREGLSRSLGQRIAGFLGALGSSPADIYDIVLQAYDVRSTFIHGGRVEDDVDVETICGKILGITRHCLISFLQLMEHNKDKIINILDRAILDEKVKEKLGELLKDVELIPIPS